MENKHFKSGFVAVIGRPNVGKSTLINSLIGQKIAIMSDKPQTTRNKIMCVLTTDNEQVIFLDTPGIHKPLHKLGEYMVKAAEGTLKEVDAILFVVDATEDLGGGERYIMERLQATKKPVILILIIDPLNTIWEQPLRCQKTHALLSSIWAQLKTRKPLCTALPHALGGEIKIPK